MNKTDYEKLEKSLENLIEQHDNYLTVDEQNLSVVTQKAVKNSVIKCFEICYDTLWKHLKKYTQEQSGLPKIPSSPLPIFRIAHENGIIDQEMQERLVNYNDLRGDTAHDYSMEKSEKALPIIGGFIQDAIELYEEMIKQA